MIVLNPTVMEPLLPADRENIRSDGIVAIDCSWKRFDEIFNKSLKGLNKRLPILIAGNPVNYGKKEKLSSAEALAAALYITGYKEYSKKLLSNFRWGKTFFDLNLELLEEYSRVTEVKEIEEIEMSYFRDPDI
jgi:pre-rRNA-processing protein TSR3